MPLEPASRGQLVLVNWIDAHAQNSWTGAGEVDHSGETVQSVGWCLKHDEAGITLVADGEQGDDPLANDVNRILFVPAGMVQSVWEIHF